METWEELDDEILSLYFPDEFWTQFVNYIIKENIEESHFWDFKGSCFFTKDKSNQIEKKELNYKILKHIVAFANLSSGVIVFGISDKKPRKIFGIKDCEKCINHIYQIIEAGINPKIRIFTQIINFEGHDCIVVIIPKSSQSISLKNPRDGRLEYYIREGSRSKLITNDDEIKDLIFNKENVKSESFSVLTYISEKTQFKNIAHMEKRLKSIFERYKLYREFMGYEELLEIFNIWSNIDSNKKKQKIQQYEKLQENVIQSIMILTFVPIFYCLIVLLYFLSNTPSLFMELLSYLGFIVIFMGNFYLGSKLLTHKRFEVKKSESGNTTQEIVLPEFMYYDINSISKLIRERKFPELVSRIHYLLSHMRHGMSAYDFHSEITKKSQRSSRSTFKIDIHYNPFKPQEEFEKWIKRKDLHFLPIPIPSDVVEFSRIFSLYIQMETFGRGLPDLARFMSKSEEVLKIMLNNQELKDRTMKYDRYYYLFRLEKEFKDELINEL